MAIMKLHIRTTPGKTACNRAQSSGSIPAGRFILLSDNVRCSRCEKSFLGQKLIAEAQNTKVA